MAARIYQKASHTRCRSGRCLPIRFTSARRSVLAHGSGSAMDLSVDGKIATSPGAWLEMMNTLKENGVVMIKPQEVAFCKEKGMAVIDIRTASQYNAGFIEGCINVPLFQPIEGWEPYQIARRVGYALFGVLNGTEPNPNFRQEIAEVVPDKETGVVLLCNVGGTLEPAPGKKTLGIQSRSLIAAYELVKMGYTDVKVLSDGMSGWIRDGRDVYVAGEEE